MVIPFRSILVAILALLCATAAQAESFPPNILRADDRPWEDLGNGSRRKVFQCDRLTLVLFEIARQGPDPAPIKTHAHEQDQVTCVLEGRAVVRVGGTEREVGPGAVYLAPSNTPHGMRVLSDRFVGLDTFSPPRRGLSVGENDVKAFVYQWFAWLDRQVDARVLTEHLVAGGLEIRYP